MILVNSQVTEERKNILEKEGFEFECRGENNVKGKGLMTTYFLKTSPDQLESQLMVVLGLVFLKFAEPCAKDALIRFRVELGENGDVGQG
ncbi:unnamed protein product [Heligmosomoides polygyrus]|uniref:Guanylate cyclase domain-containing protein n=1 Tax=Heligmosomoides polygyrus TaxID=6339 RepID=A0A183F239_HELPZ|nr:unnamed protein product [Heligmosomoides polygyrus]